MFFYSTNSSGHKVTFKDAIVRGLAPDGGLYVPAFIPQLPPSFFETLSGKSLKEIGYEVARLFLEDEIDAATLKTLVDDVLSFEIPLRQLNENTYVLELFHGPTLAFKDVGARFMARLLGDFLKSEKRDVTVLAATSGDTGSAVAHGFFNVPGIKVVILYPKNKVSRIQEQMLTTMGGNITALEVDGSFDDCQRLVKAAFVDPELQEKCSLTSANSINIARLLPQSFYYFYAIAQLGKMQKYNKQQMRIAFAVPSGNFGNLTAGLYAERMGLHVEKFIAATNANDVFPKFIASGKFTPHASVSTISNAMDVGNPSNFARMQYLYGDINEMRDHVWSQSFSDVETRAALAEVNEKYHYVCDPHGAVAYAGLEAYREKVGSDAVGVFFETAHPAKFAEVVEEVTHRAVQMPESVNQYLKAHKKSITMSSDFSTFKEFLLVP